MRENMGLYRGKRMDNGEWVEGFYMTLGGKYHYILAGKLDITCGYPDLIKFPVDHATVCEFTGLTDKNGTKIFEADVVICSMIGANYTPPCYWSRKQVVFERGAFCVEDLGGDSVPLRSYATGIEVEVIGNIHDHPKLQEVKK